MSKPYRLVETVPFPQIASSPLWSSIHRGAGDSVANVLLITAHGLNGQIVSSVQVVRGKPPVYSLADFYKVVCAAPGKGKAAIEEQHYRVFGSEPLDLLFRDIEEHYQKGTQS